MEQGFSTPTEEIRADLAVLDAALERLLSAPWTRTTDTDLTTLVQHAETSARRLFALQVLQAGQIDRRGLAGPRGCSSTAVMLRQMCRISDGEARTRVLTARDTLPITHPTGTVTTPTRPVLAAALTAGQIGAESAGITIRFLNNLPAELSPALVALAENTMVEQATLGNPHQLRKAAQELTIRLDPDGRLPTQARTRMRLDFGTRNHQGLTPITALVDDETVEKLRQAIEALAAPAPAVDGIPDPRSAANRRACALGELAQHTLNTAATPTHGGTRPNVTVFMSLNDLTGRITPCTHCGHHPTGTERPGTDPPAPEDSNDPAHPTHHGLLDLAGASPPTTTYGGPITAETARRIACDAQITPIVLGGKGEILDVGRSRYTFPTAIRKALQARDRGCAFPGCDRPPGWTEAHHILPFSAGGETKLSSAVLACDHHHTLLHHSDWEVRIAPDGIPEFLPPTWIDHQRTPRRHHRYLSTICPDPQPG